MLRHRNPVARQAFPVTWREIDVDSAEDRGHLDRRARVGTQLDIAADAQGCHHVVALDSRGLHPPDLDAADVDRVALTNAGALRELHVDRLVTDPDIGQRARPEQQHNHPEADRDTQPEVPVLGKVRSRNRRDAPADPRCQAGPSGAALFEHHRHTSEC